MDRRLLTLSSVAALAILVGLTCWLTESVPQESSLELGASAHLRGESNEGSPATPTLRSNAADAMHTDSTIGPATVDGGGAYSATVGSRFEFDLRTDSEVRFGESVDGVVGTALTGTQSTTVLARRGDELVFELRFDVKAKIAGGIEGAETELARDLERPVLVRMSQDGSVVGLRFAPETSRRSRDTVRSLVASFRFVVHVAENWESDDPEPNGVARNGYRWTNRAAGRLERKRLAFESVAHFAEIGGAPEFIGSASATHDAQLGWLVRAQYDETMGQVAGGMLPVRGSGRGTLALTRRERVSLSGTSPIGWDDPWEGLFAAAEVDSDGSPLAFERRFWSERLKGVTVSYAMSTLEMLCRCEPIDTTKLVAARQDLEWLLRLDPSQLDHVDALIGSTDPNAAQILLTAVGRVGTARCQDILLRNASLAGRPDAVRGASLFAMIGVKHPNRELLAGLERMFAPGASDRAGSTALLVAGALAGLTTEGDAIIGSLIGAQPMSGDPLLLADWMTALGNTKHSQVHAVVAQYVTHPNEAVRNAALAALENVVPPANP